MSARQNSASLMGWLTRPGLPVARLLASAVFSLCIASFSSAFGQRGAHFVFRQHGGGQHAPAPHATAPQYHAPPPQQHGQPAPSRNLPEVRAYNPPRANTQQARPGQQHLSEWFNSHQNMTPKQQEDALRREPGFQNLPADQQQRLVNRLHALDEKTPEQRQRLLERNEMFERLSPERRQEVRGAGQALSQMSPDRQQAVRRAFHQLRQMPPDERQRMLNSGSYASQFSPQERTVLGNLLSIEPYQRPGAIAQPYFGR